MRLFPKKTTRRAPRGSWFVLAVSGLVAANACVVPHFAADGREDGSGGLGGDGNDLSSSGGAAIGGSGDTDGSGGETPGGGGAGSGNGGSPGDGGQTGSGGEGTGGDGAGGSDSGGASSGGNGSGGATIEPSDLPAAPGPDDVPRPDGTPGNITVLDWAGFRAAVTYSFDDGHVSQLDHRFDLNALGSRFTFFLVTDGSVGSALTDQRWFQLSDVGHQLANHTKSHSCAANQVADANDDFFTFVGERASTLAAPNGDVACQDQAMGEVFLNRGVGPAEPILPLDGTNPFALNGYIPMTGQVASVFNLDIDDALEQNGWVIYVIHGFEPSGTAYQPIPWDDFVEAVGYAQENDVWVDTLENVGAYWLGQKSFANALSDTSGDTTTWTWVLPDEFPEEKYLRVTVDGGTLTQNGQSVAWDPHGYYEIALDELSVTLGP